MTRRWTPQTRYTLRRNTASIRKDLMTLVRTSSLRKDSFTQNSLDKPSEMAGQTFPGTFLETNFQESPWESLSRHFGPPTFGRRLNHHVEAVGRWSIQKAALQSRMQLL